MADQPFVKTTTSSLDHGQIYQQQVEGFFGHREAHNQFSKAHSKRKGLFTGSGKVHETAEIFLNGKKLASPLTNAG
jgi:hypothetical protein